jgi:hypothetical protein
MRTRRTQVAVSKLILAALPALFGCGALPPEAMTETTNTESSAAASASEVERLKLPSLWTSGPWNGSVGTFLADVTGGGTADLVAVSGSGIKVRPSSGSGFLPELNWSPSFVGSVANFIADVTGDGRADAVAIDASDVWVRRSTGTSFGAQETWLLTGFSGTVATHLVDVTGDKRADLVAFNASDVKVRRSNGSTFGSTEVWLQTSFQGSNGTFVADVTGDGLADLIGISSTSVAVRRGYGSGFGAAEVWHSDSVAGTVATRVADMTGDGLADVVAIHERQIVMYRGNRWLFGPREVIQNGTYAAGSWQLADVTGGADKRADVVHRPANEPIIVRSAQNRRIPLRFVQLLPMGGTPLTNQQLMNTVATANKAFLSAGIEFHVPAWNFHNVFNNELSDVRPKQISNPNASACSSPESEWRPDSLSESTLKLAVEQFNPACNLGYSDFAQIPRHRQLMWYVSGRCTWSGEILIYISTYCTNDGAHPAMSNHLIMDREDGMVFRNETNNTLAHELGHYLGLPHIWDGGAGHTDPETGLLALNSSFWDLVYGPGLITFDNRPTAQAFEASLLPIQIKGQGWYCPSNDPAKPCPSQVYPPGTLGLGMVGTPVRDTGSVWVTGDRRLKGLSLRTPSDGMNSINLMQYSYADPSGTHENRVRELSISQIEQLHAHFGRNNDIAGQILAASGAVLWADRPRLGLEGPAGATYRFVKTPGTAKIGPGTIASNGAETWVVGTSPFDQHGNQVHRWNPTLRRWDSINAGARQIALVSNGWTTFANVTPWAITTSPDPTIALPNAGVVKRWNGSTFADILNGTGLCVTSLAVGPRDAGTSLPYAWATGCTLGANGNRPIFRYRQLDGIGGWVQVIGAAVQVAVDQKGIPFARTNEGTVWQAVLDANGMPTGWNQLPMPTGRSAKYLATGGNRFFPQPPVALGDDGHIFTRSSLGTWFDAATPAPTLAQITGTMPFVWAVASDQTIWYGR